MSTIAERPRCRTRGCKELIGEESRWFCDGHAAVLARVREDVDGKAGKFRATIGRKNRRPTCCRPGCTNGRIPPARYCYDCEQEGWDEADYNG
jgi:hypothetical protein